jgi:hypothetical protein
VIPNVAINFNEVFANTKIYDELSTVIFGAELALRYANVPEAQMNDIRKQIVRSAFTSFSLNYDAMNEAVESLTSASPARSEDAPQTGGGFHSFTEDAESFDSGVSEDYKQTVVYENYPDPGNGADENMRLTDAVRPESGWEEGSGKEENAAFGNIHWTTYSSASNLGGLTSSVSLEPSEADSGI